MTLADAVLRCSIAYYGGGRDVQALRRTARLCIRRLGPGKAKPLALLLRASDPGAVLEAALEAMQEDHNDGELAV